MSLLIQIINREAKEAIAHPSLPIEVRKNLQNMLAEASKAQVALTEIDKERRVFSWERGP